MTTYVETHSPSYRIKKARIDKNLSLKELSSLSEISYNYITALESGKYKPNFKVLNRLSQALDKPVWYWYLGCYEDMPEDNFTDKLKKARHYHGDSKKDLANKIGANNRSSMRTLLILSSVSKYWAPLSTFLEYSYFIVILSPSTTADFK